MVSDMNYYCRLEKQKEWERFSDHPCRPLQGVADLYARKKGIQKGVVRVRRSLESPVEEFNVNWKD